MNKTWKVTLAFLGVFLAGAVFGGFVSLRVARTFLRDKWAKHAPAMEQFVPMILRKYSARLELTPEQQEKIRPIVKAADEKLRSLRRSSFADTIAVANKMNEEISAVLTPRQQEELKAMLQEMRERWQKDRERRMRDRKQRQPGEMRPANAPPPPADAPPAGDPPPPPAPQ